jgi:hypothetical protein
MQRLIDEMITAGYAVKTRGPESAFLKKKTWGNVDVIIVLIVLLIAALVLAQFTLGLSFLLPIAYVVFKHQTADTVAVTIDSSLDLAGPSAQSYVPLPNVQSLTNTPPPQVPSPATHAPVTSELSSSHNTDSSEAALSSLDAQSLTSSDVDSSRTQESSVHLSHFNQVDLLIFLVSLFWGMIAGVVVTLPLQVVLTVPDGVIAFIEEPVKLLPLIVVAIWYPSLLYSKKKCAVFGAVAGLGFGAMENLWYFVHVPRHLFVGVVVGRTVFLPTHLIYSALTAMSLMYIASRRQYYYAVLLLALAILFHFVWNTVTQTEIYIVLYPLLIVLFVLIYRTVPDHVADQNVPPTTLDELFHRDLSK